MNEFGLVLVVIPVMAVFSLPFVALAILMKLVGRIRMRTLWAVLIADAILWATAAFCSWPTILD